MWYPTIQIMSTINEYTQNFIPPLELKSVQDLLGTSKYSFVVPGYQRGYRWTAEDVKILIEDLLLFQNEENQKPQPEKCPFYSLQVLVVKESEERTYEVIDGQQRLTTVLIILQAIRCIQAIHYFHDYEALLQTARMDPTHYSIRYETRGDSSQWLEAITKAYYHDLQDSSRESSNNLKKQNPDYSHFVDAFYAVIDFFNNLTQDDLNDFAKTLRQNTKFIWYNITKSNLQVADSEVDIFNRLNATKINLNNAELIKALLLQDGNFADVHNLIYERDQMAIDWDNLEKQLQNPNLWEFAYSSRHPYKYDTHIEYLFDLITGKTAEDKDAYYFTFKRYYDNYSDHKDDKLSFVREEWKKIQKMFLLIQEWYNDKCCYHYIGYLLEYGRTADNKPISIPYLKDLLYNKNKDQRESILKNLIKDSLKGIKGEDLIYKNKNILNQVLLLFNIELEQRRQNNTSRFSFAEYKYIRDTIGWNLEHVASNVDYEPKWEKRKELASDLLEYFTGIKYTADCQISDDELQSLCSDKEAKELCKNLRTFYNETVSNEFMISVYDSIMKYFEAEDKFREYSVNNKFAREKDFIWNFVLLNSSTNKSYGNNIFPVKRRRIQEDDNSIYTPIGTRAVFEKAYSKKLSNLISWGRNDAIDYWTMISETLREFMPDLKLPSYITLD